MALDRDSGAESQRLDVWLCNARFLKSRTLAQSLIADGKVRLNRERITKPSQLVKAGDVVTLSLGPRVRVIEIKAFAARRGPALQAAALYAELTPKPTSISNAAEQTKPRQAVRDSGSGRPTKRDRRRIDRLTGDRDEP